MPFGYLPKLFQLMEVGVVGHHGVVVQKLVVVEFNQCPDLATIPLLDMEARAAVGQLMILKPAILMIAQVLIKGVLLG